MTTTPTPLTTDEIQECIDLLETNYHPDVDFESECPGCTAKEKLKAMLAARTAPAGMLQDDSREFSRWLSSRPNARQEVRDAIAQPVQPVCVACEGEPAIENSPCTVCLAIAQPVQLTRKALSDAEILTIAEKHLIDGLYKRSGVGVLPFARAILKAGIGAQE